MSVSLIHTLIMALAFLLLFGSAEILYHIFHVKAELTRKYVHFSTGILTLFFPSFIGNHWFVLLLCASFLIILLVSLKYNLLPSINAVDRVTHGSILYPVIVYGCYLMYDHYDSLVFYFIPILTLAVCDPMAALVGKKFPWKSYHIFGHSKTMSGSLTFFTTSVLITTLVLNLLINEISITNVLLIGIFLAFFTAIIEAISHKGYDNFTIPVVALLVLMVCDYFRLLI